MSSTIRHENLPSRNLILVNRAWFRDDRLSLQARGLLAWFVTFGPDEEINEWDVADATGVELSEVSNGPLGELERAGYLTPNPYSDNATVAFVLNDPHA